MSIANATATVVNYFRLSVSFRFALLHFTQFSNVFRCNKIFSINLLGMNTHITACKNLCIFYAYTHRQRTHKISNITILSLLFNCFGGFDRRRRRLLFFFFHLIEQLLPTVCVCVRAFFPVHYFISFSFSPFLVHPRHRLVVLWCNHVCTKWCTFINRNDFNS